MWANPTRCMRAAFPGSKCPGMALTCELWLGPATHLFANASLEATLVEMEEGAPDKRAE